MLVAEVSDCAQNSEIEGTGQTAGNLGSQDNFLDLQVGLGSLPLCSLGLLLALRRLEVRLGDVSVGVSVSSILELWAQDKAVTHPSAPKRARVPATAAPTIRLSQGWSLRV